MAGNELKTKLVIEAEGRGEEKIIGLGDEVGKLSAAAEQAGPAFERMAGEMEKAAAVLADRELLGVRAHADIQKEIDETRAAYERLKASGELTQTELAQAAMKTEERVRELQKQTNGWAESLGNAKTAIAGLAASGAGIAAVVKQAVNFESAMADVVKVVEGTDEQMAALVSRIKEMTASIPMAATELAQMAAAGGQLGVPIEKLEQFVELSAQMATAFNMSADEAGQAVAKLSNVFNLPLEQVGRLGDAINTLGNTTAATEGEIVNVLTRIGGTATQFGLTAEQASALAASMLSLGVRAEVAGTGINAILSKLQTANVQGKAFQEALAEMGLSAKQLAADIEANPQRALETFLQTLSSLEGAQKAEILSRLFGAEYQDDVARLLGGLEGYGQALARVGDAAQTAGAMQREFEARVQTTEAQLELLKNGVQTLAINLGSTLLPILQPIVEKLGDVAHGMAQFAEQFPNIARLAGALTALLPSIAALKMAWLAAGVAGSKAVAAITLQVKLMNQSLPEAIAAVGKLRSAALLASAAFVGWDIGKQLSAQFLEVEQAGIALAAGLTKIAARAQAAWEMLKAPFTDDTVAAAQQRLHERLAQIDEDYADLFDTAARVRDAQQQQAAASDAAAAAGRQAEQVQAAARAQSDLGDAIARGDTATAVRNFESLAHSASGLAAALDAMRSKLDVGSADSVAGFARAMEELQAKGVLSARLIGQEWQATLAQLDEGQLARFGDALGQAFDKGLISAEQLARANEQVLAASFDRLGVSAAQAMGRASLGAQQAAEAFELVARQMQAAGLSAEQAAQGLEMAFAAAVPRAESLADIEQLQARLDGVAASGRVGAEGLDRMRAALDAQGAAIRQQLPGVQGLEEALRRLGVTPQAELKRMAQVAREAYDAVKSSGQASAREMAEAWRAMAQAQIEANDGAASAALKAQAAQHGMVVQVDAAGKAIVRSMQEAAQATGHVGRAALQAGQDAAQGAQTARAAAQGVGEAAAEGADKAKNAHEAMAQAVQHAWLSASAQASKYADEAARHAQALEGQWQSANGRMIMGWGQYIDAWNVHFKTLRQLADEYAESMQRIDAAQARLNAQNSGAARGVEDLRLRLLELGGSEEQLAQARAQRERDAVQRQIEITRLEAERAALRKDHAALERLNEEIALYEEQLALLGQIAAAERRQREQKAREKARAVDGRGAGGGSDRGSGMAAAPMTINLTANGVNDPARLARMIEPELRRLARLSR